jgi:hypothetical protein
VNGSYLRRGRDLRHPTRGGRCRSLFLEGDERTPARCTRTLTQPQERANAKHRAANAAPGLDGPQSRAFEHLASVGAERAVPDKTKLSGRGIRPTSVLTGAARREQPSSLARHRLLRPPGPLTPGGVLGVRRQRLRVDS